MERDKTIIAFKDQIAVLTDRSATSPSPSILNKERREGNHDHHQLNP